MGSPWAGESHLSLSCKANGLDGELRRCDGRTEGFNRTGLTNTVYGPCTDSVQNRIIEYQWTNYPITRYPTLAVSICPY